MAEEGEIKRKKVGMTYNHCISVKIVSFSYFNHMLKNTVNREDEKRYFFIDGVSKNYLKQR